MPEAKETIRVNASFFTSGSLFGEITMGLTSPERLYRYTFQCHFNIYQDVKKQNYHIETTKSG
ncbi:hypothetical protein CBFG_01572 [Clostridiales bacterium 1_7_47FAA]|nr:hypothetical protein CBFG_01572 [Clostridiales bacterium 1_7_47FAA]